MSRQFVDRSFWVRVGILSLAAFLGIGLGYEIASAETQYYGAYINRIWNAEEEYTLAFSTEQNRIYYTSAYTFPYFCNGYCYEEYADFLCLESRGYNNSSYDNGDWHMVDDEYNSMPRNSGPCPSLAVPLHRSRRLAMRMLLVLPLASAALAVGALDARAQGPPPARQPPNPGVFPPRIALTFPAGWNILAGSVAGGLLPPPPPPGSPPPSTTPLLYTLQAGDSNYEVITAASHPPGTAVSPVRPETGYWAYLPQQMEFDVFGSTRKAEIPLPPGQFVMIGNPMTREATVTGADLVYTYDPVEGVYQEASTLDPGQGAFAYSASGGTVTVDGLFCPPDPTIVCDGDP